jgi:hypothetical protein
MNQYFIVGCIRSGTTFFCDMFTDFVDEVYNETGDRNIHNRLHLKDKNFAFKFCEDFKYIHNLKEIFPKSQFFLVVRDLRDSLNSIYNPNDKSIPRRVFPIVEKRSNELNITMFEAGLSLLYDYYVDINRLIIAREDVNNILVKTVMYDDICKNPNYLKAIFDELFPENIKPIDYYQKKILKTPNQKSHLNWNEEQKNMFKTYKNGFFNKLIIHFNFEKDENW